MKSEGYYASMSDLQLQQLFLHLTYVLGRINNTIPPKINRRTGKPTKEHDWSHMKNTWTKSLGLVNLEIETRKNLKQMEV